MTRKIILYACTVILIICGVYIAFDTYDEQKSIKLTESLNQTHDKTMDIGPYTDENELENDEWLNVISDGTVKEPEETTVTKREPVVDTWDKNETTIDAKPVPEETEQQTLEILRSMEPLYAQNTDTVGWLEIPNTKINNVVVQTTDNDFYLNHNFNKEYSQPGTLFVDFRCIINDYEDYQTHNMIIYGHKQKSGSMFGTLHNYHNNIDFYKENPTFTFSTLYETYTYKIVAMFSCPTTGDNVFDYHNYIDLPEDGDYSFDRWIKNIRALSEVATPVSTKPDDYYLTLSTCSYDYVNGRFVVIARRVRDHESTNVEVQYAFPLTH